MPAIQHCLLENLFRVAFGHAPTEAVAPLLAGYQDAFTRAKHRWPELLAELAVSEGFRMGLPAP